MKHVILLLIFVSGFFNATAQFNKGDMFMGGGFGISINTIDRASQTKSSDFSIDLSPNLGYFINESSAIGLIPQINFFRSTTSVVGYGHQSTNILSGGMGMFYKKYFTLVDNFYLFFEPRAIYSTSLLGEDDRKSFRLSISPGASYRISPKWMVEAGLGGLVYGRSFYVSGAEQQSIDSRFAFDLITSNSIGIIYFFKQSAL